MAIANVWPRELPLIRERYPLALTPPARGLRDRLPFGIRHWLSNRFGIGTSLLYGLRPEVAARLSVENALPAKVGFDPLANALEQDSFGRYLTTLLRYGDRNSMAHSREVRLAVLRPPHRRICLSPAAASADGRGADQAAAAGIDARHFAGGYPHTLEQAGFPPAAGSLVPVSRIPEIGARYPGYADFRQSPYWIAGWWHKALDRVEQGELGLGWTLWHPFIVEQWRQHFLKPLIEQRACEVRGAA